MDQQAMKTVVHRSGTRGAADHGWLKARHSFSFADHYDPERMQFGALRVLNDDTIAPSAGFGMHPHRDMEIVTIPLSGALKHQDSMGHSGVVKAGEVQVMSAGTGVTHSEFNASSSEELRLFQIWVMPRANNAPPRYDQVQYNMSSLKDGIVTLVAPKDAPTWVGQNAWFSLTDMAESVDRNYDLHGMDQGVYIMVVNGEIELNGETLKERDAMGIWETENFALRANASSRVLFVEVPMLT